MTRKYYDVLLFDITGRKAGLLKKMGDVFIGPYTFCLLVQLKMTTRNSFLAENYMRRLIKVKMNSNTAITPISTQTVYTHKMSYIMLFHILIEA